MRNYSLSHLSDAALRRDLKEQSRKETGLTAWVLAHIAEFQERRLYREDGYASMYAWCVGELGYCEQAAYKRINAARVALRFPVIFAMLAEGRLTLSAVVALSAHLIESNAEDLLAAAAAKTVREIEQLLAERFPRPDLATVIQSLAPASSPAPDLDQLSSRRVDGNEARPGLVPAEVPRPRVTPLAPQRSALQTTIDQETRDLLRRAQDLLGHEIAASDVATVLDRTVRWSWSSAGGRPDGGAPDASVSQGWRSEHSAAAQRRRMRRGACRRQVCRLPSRTRARRSLEFDHVHAFAREGRATVGNIRLRCRAHNRLEAERTFGTEFMRHKQEGPSSAAPAT